MACNCPFCWCRRRRPRMTNEQKRANIEAYALKFKKPYQPCEMEALGRMWKRERDPIKRHHYAVLANETPLESARRNIAAREVAAEEKATKDKSAVKEEIKSESESESETEEDDGVKKEDN